jgi:hypothetical protein
VAQPWERLTGESPQAFEAFAAYRDMGAERSLAKVARQLGKSTTLMERWSVGHHWVRRVDAWVVEADRVHRAFLLEHGRVVSQRLLRVAGAMQAKLVEALQALDVRTLTPRDVGYWLDITSKVQRQALGLGDKVELSGPDGGPVELAHLSPAEAAVRLGEIAAEIRRRLEDNPLAVVGAEPGDDDWGEDPDGADPGADAGAGG